MLVAGVAAYLLEANRFPIAPAILGVVLGGMLEENFITSMIKADGNLLAFVERPIAAGLGVLTIAIWLLPVVVALLSRRRASVPRPAGPERSPSPGRLPAQLLTNAFLPTRKTS